MRDVSFLSIYRPTREAAHACKHKWDTRHQLHQIKSNQIKSTQQSSNTPPRKEIPYDEEPDLAPPQTYP